MIENKNILFIVNGSNEWIGGLYYTKNIIYTLLKNNKINSSSNIYIVGSRENLDIFRLFSKYENIKIVPYRNNLINKVLKKISHKIWNRTFDLELYIKSKLLNINYIYPVRAYPHLLLEDKSVHWIPDFQHIHLPELFSKDEIDSRNRIFDYIAKEHKNLILSSEDAFNDYKSLYPNYIKGVHVMSFESCIEDEVKGIDNSFIEGTMKKYKLPNEFIFLPNQFWMHKNHITAFKAINYVVNNKGKNVCLVCTGNTSDNRNKDYFNSLLDFIKQNKLESNIRILGFISRKEQLALMQLSIAVVQPSLFEGWGTVVEDAKALGKNIIMSDIDVHYEQKNEKCIFFKRNDYNELGEIIYNLFK